MTESRGREGWTTGGGGGERGGYAGKKGFDDDARGRRELEVEEDGDA